MTDDHQEDDMEQYSQESRTQLRDRAEALATALEQHTTTLLEMTGGTSTPTALFQLNDDIRKAAAAWDDAVFDHTGTFPIAIESLDEDEDEDDDLDQDERDGPNSAEAPLAVSVMSRWDLDIIDPAALIQAGQAAHQRLNPSWSEADIDGVGQALYAIVHEHGEPWFEMPGVGTVAGHRAYLRRDDDQPQHSTRLTRTWINHPSPQPAASCTARAGNQSWPAPPTVYPPLASGVAAVPLVDRLAGRAGGADWER